MTDSVLYKSCLECPPFALTDVTTDERIRINSDAAITSRRPYDVFIGYPCDSEYCSKSLSLFTNV